MSAVVKYRHVRKNFWQKEFSCFTTVNPKLEFTMAYEVNKPANQVFFAVAVCSKKDKYCKAKGRSLALARWSELNSHSFPILNNNLKQTLDEIQRVVSKDPIAWIFKD